VADDDKEDVDGKIAESVLSLSRLLPAVNAFSLRSRSSFVMQAVLVVGDFEAALLLLGAKIIGGFDVWSA